MEVAVGTETKEWMGDGLWREGTMESMRHLCSDIGVLEAEKRFAVREKRLQGQLGMMKRRYAEVKKELSRAQDASV